MSCDKWLTKIDLRVVKPLIENCEDEAEDEN